MNLARNSDPDTSHAAAMQQRNLVRERQRILDAFTRLGPMTDSELEDVATREEWPHAGDTYYRRRRSDLKALGALTSTNERRANAQGNTETVWQVANTDRGKKMENWIMFTKLDDDTWGIAGPSLVEGDEVVVHTKDGSEVHGTVCEVLDEKDGRVIARFDRARAVPADGHAVFRKVDGEWIIQGKGLAEGQLVEVLTRAGHGRKVRVAEVIDVDDAGMISARFSDPGPDPDTVIFVRNPDDDSSFLIRGKNLTPGEYVSVTKKNGSTVEVLIREIINQTDDFNLALWSDRDDMPDVN